MKNAILTLSMICIGSFAFAQAPATPPSREQMKQEREAEAAKVKAACSAEIAATGCKEELGHGLLKCIHEYKEKNKDFKVSDACHASVKEGREMHKERKMMRMERKNGNGSAPAETPPTK